MTRGASRHQHSEIRFIAVTREQRDALYAASRHESYGKLSDRQILILQEAGFAWDRSQAHVNDGSAARRANENAE